MGWSCRADAANTMDRWTEFCIAQSGSQNTFKANGHTYFWEASRTEHSDGAITGSVHKMLPGGLCRKSGTFRIEGNGQVTRAPACLAELGAPDPIIAEQESNYNNMIGQSLRRI